MQFGLIYFQDDIPNKTRGVIKTFDCSAKRPFTARSMILFVQNNIANMEIVLNFDWMIISYLTTEDWDFCLWKRTKFHHQDPPLATCYKRPIGNTESNCSGIFVLMYHSEGNISPITSRHQNGRWIHLVFDKLEMLIQHELATLLLHTQHVPLTPFPVK